ncbi:phosphatases II, partial [Setomelanomma holmii]
QLREHGITHVLSLLASGSTIKIPRELGFRHDVVEIEDNPFADLLGILDEACAFIDAALHTQTTQDMKMLVHSLQRICRSAAVVVGYVMRTLGLDCVQAVKVVQDARPILMANAGFAEQLELWERMGHAVRTDDGEEKAVYSGWKIRRDWKRN